MGQCYEALKDIICVRLNDVWVPLVNRGRFLHAVMCKLSVMLV